MLICLLSGFLLTGPTSLAQSDGNIITNQNATGVIPFNSYQLGDVDNVNLGAGAVNVHIPLVTLKGRAGLDDGIQLNFSSKFYTMNFSRMQVGNAIDDFLSWTFALDSPQTLQLSSLQTGQLRFDAGFDLCVFNHGLEQFYVHDDSNFTYVAPNGSKYLFPNRLVYPTAGFVLTECNTSFDFGDQQSTSTGLSDSGTLQLTVSLNVTTGAINSEDVTDKSGKHLLGVTDTNGNETSFFSFNGKDSVGRSVTQTNNADGSITLTLLDSNGQPQNYTLYYQNTPLTGQFPTSAIQGITISNTSVKNIGSQGNLHVMNKVALPNGTSYLISYQLPDGTTNPFGEPTKITFPTGGYVRYVYQTLPSFDYYLVDGLGPCFFTAFVDSRRVVERDVSVDGVTEQKWQYAYQYISASNTYTTTVTDPMGNVTVHTFDAVGLHELSTEVRNGASTVIRRVTNTWASDNGPVQALQARPITNVRGGNCTGPLYTFDFRNYRITNTTIALVDTNQVSQKSTTFDSYSYQVDTNDNGVPVTYTDTRMNPVEVDEYDFGNGVVGPLLRKTTYGYLHDSNSNYLSRHIWDRVTLRQVFDNASNTCKGVAQPCAKTQFAYDSTTLMPASGAVQHDYTDYPSTMTFRGDQTQIQRWRNTDGALLTTTQTFDELGNLRQIVDPLGNPPTTFSYSDSWSTQPGGGSCAPAGGTAQALVTTTSNSLAQATTKTYYSCQSLVASTTDPNLASTSYFYDDIQRLVGVTLPNGAHSSMIYNDTSLPASATLTEPITALLNKVTTEVFDGLGRVTQSKLTSDPQGATYSVITYDALGRKYQVYNPTRCSPPTTNCGEATWGYTTYIYDALGRPCVVVPPDGTTVSGSTCPSAQPSNDVFTTFVGNTSTVTDQQEKARESRTDGLGRLTTIWEYPSGLNYETDYAYDVLDNLTGVVENGSRTRTFVYDSLSHLSSSNNPETGTTIFTYDANGNVLTRKDARAITAIYAYDPLNRIKSNTYSDGTPAVAFKYDLSAVTMGTSQYTITNPIGRLSSAAALNSSGVPVVMEVLSYDVMGRRNAAYQCTPVNCAVSGWAFSYQYDLLGDLIQFTNGVFPVYNQTFDAAARVTALTSSDVDSQHPATLATVDSTLGYYPNGSLRKLTYGNGLTETAAFNNRLQLCRSNLNSSSTSFSTCTDAIPSGSVQDFTYGFNLGSADNGNVMSMTGVGQESFSRSYTFDQLNRISTMTAPGDTCSGLSWTYDAWGNRLGQTATGGTCSAPQFSFTPSNQISNSGFTYDLAGNLTHDANHSYTYDAENRITAVDGGATAVYVYDAYGRRVEKTMGSATPTHYLFDSQGRVVSEVQITTWNPSLPSTGWHAGYNYLSGKLIAEYASNTTYFLQSDQIGSTRLVTKMDHTILDSMDYLPFGEQIRGASGTTHKFTGKDRDGTSVTETGLDYFGARHMSSSIGRFMSPDPENAGAINVDPQTWNAYSYVRNNPLIYTDPDGERYQICDVFSNCQSISDNDFAHYFLDSPNVRVDGNLVFINGQFEGTAHQTSYDDATGGQSNDFLGGFVIGAVTGGAVLGTRALFGSILRSGTEGAITGGAAPAAAEQIVATGAKATVRQAIEDATISDVQKAAVKQVLTHARAGQDIVVEKLTDGTLRVTRVAIGDAGGRSEYITNIAVDGTRKTIQYGYDAANQLVHVDPK